MTQMTFDEILTNPPDEPEGDDQEAAKGTELTNVPEGDLEDVEDHGDEDDETDG